MSKSALIVNIPTEAGTHWYGQSLAPKALEKAGLSKKLGDLGYTVSTLNPELPKEAIWQPSRIVNGVRNENATVSTLSAIQSALDGHFAKQASKESMPFTIFIGGPCTIAQPILSSLSRHFASLRTGIIWFDNDADLTLPGETGELGASAILDSMALSHLTGRTGGLESMRRFTGPEGKALVDASNVMLFGLDVTQPKPLHFAYLLDKHFRAISGYGVKEGDAVALAKEAVGWLEERVDKVLVHFDVDVIDSGEFPLGNFPSYGGVSYEKAMEALKVFLASDKVCGLTIAEINPNNHPDGLMVSMICDGVVKALRGRVQS